MTVKITWWMTNDKPSVLLFKGGGIMDKKKTVPNHEIDVCDDKGEVNIHIRIKIDWENKRYWLKHVKLDHVDLTRKENQ